MTYCVAVTLDAGMVFASDSRTNAGVDNIASVRKMYVFSKDGDRVIVMLTAGNLSITQSAIKLLEEHARRQNQTQTIMNAESMYDVADLTGQALRDVRNRNAPFLQQGKLRLQRIVHRRRPDPRRGSAAVGHGVVDFVEYFIGDSTEASGTLDQRG